MTLLTATASALCGVLLISSPVLPNLMGKGGADSETRGLLTGPASPSFVEPTPAAQQPMTLSGVVLRSTPRASASPGPGTVPVRPAAAATGEPRTSARISPRTAPTRRSIEPPRGEPGRTRPPHAQKPPVGAPVTVTPTPSVPPVPEKPVTHPVEGPVGGQPTPPVHLPKPPVHLPKPPVITPPPVRTPPPTGTRPRPAAPAIAAHAAIRAMRSAGPPAPRIVSDAVTAVTGAGRTVPDAAKGTVVPLPRTVTHTATAAAASDHRARTSQQVPAPVITAVPTPAPNP